MTYLVTLVKLQDEHPYREEGVEAEGACWRQGGKAVGGEWRTCDKAEREKAKFARLLLGTPDRGVIAPGIEVAIYVNRFVTGGRW